MSQFVVLGMHRSGTTLLTRVLDDLGCYTGPESAFDPGGTDHPKGYWEYRDVWRIDEDALACLDAAWDDPANVDLTRLPPARRAQLDNRIRGVVRELDAHRPWAIKDPRLCLLLPLWRPALSAPVCIFVFRRPLEVALSLQRRDGSPLVAGFALWELYNRAAIENSRGVPRIMVSHSQLLAAPEATIRELASAIERLAGPLPGSAAAAAHLVRPDLHRERGDSQRENELLSAPQLQLLEQLQRDDFGDAPMAPLSGSTAEILRQFGESSRALQRLHRNVRAINTLDASLAQAGAEAAPARATIIQLVTASVAQAEELAALWLELDALALPAGAPASTTSPARAHRSLGSDSSQSARRGRLQQELEGWLDRAGELAAQAGKFLSG